MDAAKVTALTLLDLSAAFDTIDHTILLRRVDDWFGVTGKALNWFESYLTGRCNKDYDRWLFVLQRRSQIRSPSRVSFRSSIFHALYHSIEQHDLWGVKINPAKSACNLGVIFDKNFPAAHIFLAVCSSCFYHIWDLRCIRRHLDLDNAKLLATDLVSSRLD